MNILLINQVYKLDDEVGTRLNEIDMSSIDTRLTAQLVLPQQFLEYGFYELEYSVMMTPGKDGVPFSSKVSTFIEIVRYVSNKHDTFLSASVTFGLMDFWYYLKVFYRETQTYMALDKPSFAYLMTYCGLPLL